jgi:hypothetical protein
MRLTLSVVAVAFAVACNDSFEAPPGTVPGIYAARTFTTTDSAGTTTNWISAGGSLNLILAPGGAAGGQLVIPGAGPAGSDLVASMTGTWELTGNIVHFTQTANTFVRDMPWVAGENLLTGDHTIDGTRVKAVLVKEAL